VWSIINTICSQPGNNLNNTSIVCIFIYIYWSLADIGYKLEIGKYIMLYGKSLYCKHGVRIVLGPSPQQKSICLKRMRKPRDLVNNAADYKQICVVYKRLFIFPLEGGGCGLVQFSVPSWHKKNEF
jgi:hypothetical protein